MPNICIFPVKDLSISLYVCGMQSILHWDIYQEQTKCDAVCADSKCKYMTLCPNLVIGVSYFQNACRSLLGAIRTNGNSSQIKIYTCFLVDTKIINGNYLNPVCYKGYDFFIDPEHHLVVSKRSMVRRPLLTTHRRRPLCPSNAHGTLSFRRRRVRPSCLRRARLLRGSVGKTYQTFAGDFLGDKTFNCKKNDVKIAIFLWSHFLHAKIYWTHLWQGRHKFSK